MHFSLNYYLEIISKDAKLVMEYVSVMIYESFDVHHFDPAHSTSTIQHL